MFIFVDTNARALITQTQTQSTEILSNNLFGSLFIYSFAFRFHFLFAGILVGHRCNIERNTWRKTQMGIQNVRCGWQRRYRYPRNDQNSSGKWRWWHMAHHIWPYIPDRQVAVSAATPETDVSLKFSMQIFTRSSNRKQNRMIFFPLHWTHRPGPTFHWLFMQIGIQVKRTDGHTFEIFPSRSLPKLCACAYRPLNSNEGTSDKVSAHVLHAHFTHIYIHTPGSRAHYGK